jgi:hypothetical protein
MKPMRDDVLLAEAVRAAGAVPPGQEEIPARSGRLAHAFLLHPGRRVYIRQDPSGQFRLWQPPTESPP